MKCKQFVVFVNYQLCNLVHKFLFIIKRNCLQHIAIILHKIMLSIITAQKNRNDLHLQSCQTAIGKKIIRFKASQLWNLLPNDLKQIQSYNSFKSRLKICIKLNSNSN